MECGRLWELVSKLSRPGLATSRLRMKRTQTAIAVGFLWLAVTSFPVGNLFAQEPPLAGISAIQPCKEARSAETPEHMVRPKYPKQALKAGVGGTVELKALVGSDGKTKNLAIIQGDPVLAASAVQAVRKWRFRPALVRGEPVETSYKVLVRFVPILQEAITDLEIEWPREDVPDTDPDTSQFEFETPEGPVYKLLSQHGLVSPRAIYSPEPEFSDTALRAKEQGTVVLGLIVGTDGVPRNIKVNCSSVPDLNENAVESVKAWRFEPGTKDGKPVMVEIGVEVSFQLFDKP